MRERKKSGPYVDDDPRLLAALARAEEEHRMNTKDLDAARNAGFAPHRLEEFERSCCAVPDKLKQKTGRYCSIRNHILGKAQRAPAKFLTFDEAKRGLGAEFSGGGKDAADAAAVYNCLHHHGIINCGVMEDHHPARVLAPSGQLLSRLSSGALGVGAIVSAAGGAGNSSAAASPKAAPATRLRVVVVGAGAAGLAAARQLTLSGHQVSAGRGWGWLIPFLAVAASKLALNGARCDGRPGHTTTLRAAHPAPTSVGC
jgi:hypothetical protein